jgi:hypothetical protein
MLLILSPHLTLLYPGLLACLLGMALTLVPLFAPGGIAVGHVKWAPIFIGPLLLVLGAQAAVLGALASHRSELTPARLHGWLEFIEGPGAVDSLLSRFLLVALGGLALDAALFGIWVSGNAADRMLGLAGIAQASIVVGLGGIITVLAADFARESLLEPGAFGDFALRAVPVPSDAQPIPIDAPAAFAGDARTS